PVRSPYMSSSRLMMRPSGLLKRFMTNLDYQFSHKPTMKKKPLCVRMYGCDHLARQTLLPLHLSFCRTTLKNEGSGNEASGSVFLALRIVTIDPRSTWIGLRPSRVRKTG